MARKILKRYLPDPEWIKRQRALAFLGEWVHDPNIWHLTRHSVAKAAFIGLFSAFIPVPTQMIIAGVLAVAFRANMAICLLGVWITNPLTMAPIFYMAYKVGAAVLGTPAKHFNFELSWDWVTGGLANIWEPFLLGCLLCGLFGGLLSSALVRLLWRWYAIHRWHQRRLRRAR